VERLDCWSRRLVEVASQLPKEGGEVTEVAAGRLAGQDPVELALVEL
jgi:hypothetical protein